MRRILITLTFLLFFSSSVSLAQMDIIKSDFSALDGVIIMPVDKEYLIDLDIASGIHEGDILTLVTEGEKVIHPVTKEVLGTLDVPTGYLIVTRIKSGYSYARLISSSTTPRKGDKVKRFEQVPAETDLTVPIELRNQLHADLPQLDWTTTQPIIAFSYLNHQLILKGPDDSTIRTYNLADENPQPFGVNPPASAAVDPFSIQPQASTSDSILNSAVNGMLGSIGLESRDRRLETPGIIYSRQQNSNVWISTPFSGLPVAVTVGDFDGDNQQEIALVTDNSIQIIRLNGETMTELATVTVNAATTILGLDTIDVTGDSILEIVVNTINDSGTLNSQLIQFDNGNYMVMAKELPWFLRSCNLNEQGQVLFGQQLGSNEIPFSGPIAVMAWEHNNLIPQKPLQLPPGTPIFALSSLAQPQGQNLFAAISNKDRLQILSEQGTQLWQSGNDFGGSETGFYAHRSTADELLAITYVQPKIAKLSADKILVAQNDGSRFLQRFRNYDPSRVVALTWDGAILKELWHTTDQDAYLADLAIGDANNDGQQELVTLIRYKGGNIISKSESNLVFYKLNNLR